MSEWIVSAESGWPDGLKKWPSPEANSHSAIIAAAMPKKVDVEGKGGPFPSGS